MKTISRKQIKEYIKANLKELVLYGILIVISFVLLSRKVDYMVDELLTFNLSNVRDLFEPAEGVTYSPAGQPFVDAMASNGTFDLSHVWFQQANDTHPPLYYILVHAMCTLHPGTVSIRYAGMINVLFLLLSFWAYRKIIKITIKDENVVFLASVMFVFSAGLLSMVTLLRMYVMAMFWITLFTYQIIRRIEKYETKDFILLGVSAACGALTHYYCVAYDFFISVCVVIICVLKRRYGEIIKYAISMAVAGVVSVLVFPAMITHVFNDERGTESFANLAESDFVSRVARFFAMLSDEIFGGLLAITFCALASLLIALFADKKKTEEERISFATTSRFVCLLIPPTCYFLLVAKSAPFFTERYISPIFAVVLAVVVSIVFAVIKMIMVDTKKTRILVALLIAVVIFCGFKDYEWKYLYRDRLDALNNAERFGGAMANAICVYDQKWKINPDYLEISRCGTSTFYKVPDYDSFSHSVDENLFDEKLALFVIGQDDQLFVDRFMDDHPEYVLACDNGQWGYGHSYYFQKN